MKGDFTKLSFDPRKRHSRVYLQQGRVQLDSDFNELVDLLTDARRRELVDLIGRHGGPATRAGFEIALTHQLRLDGNWFLQWPTWKAVNFTDGRPFSIEARLIPSGTARKGGVILGCMGKVGYYLSLEESYQVGFHYKHMAHTEAQEQGIADPVLSVVGFRCLRPDQVNHIAITYDGTQLSLFVNGVLDVRKRVVLQPTADTKSNRHRPMTLGALYNNDASYQADGLSRFFSGILEEVRFWNIARDPSDLAARIYDELTPKEKGLVGLVPLNEGRGRECADLVSGNRGVLKENPDGDAKPRIPWEPDLRIGAGRYYVDGICCTNEVETSYLQQPDLPEATLPDVRDNGSWLAYLEVWELLVTALEDADLAEPALNGIDTAVRTRVVNQVKLLPVSRFQNNTWPEWRALLTSESQRGLMIAERKDAAQILDNQLYRVEVHRGGGVYGAFADDRDISKALAVKEVRKQKRAGRDVEVFQFDAQASGLPDVGQLVEIYSSRTDADGTPGRLTLVTGRGADWVELADNMGIREEDAPQLRPIATFKWSTDNGAMSWPVRSLERLPDGSGVVQLVDAGRAGHRLVRDAWVELVHPSRQLGVGLSPLVKIAYVKEATSLIISAPLPLDWDKLNAPGLKLVLWDQRGTLFQPGPETAVDDQTNPLYEGLIPARTRGITLEKGITVRFSRRGTLRAGDYWMIPARTRLEQGIDWPADKQGNALMVSPHGYRRHYAPLALIQARRGSYAVTDLRKLFAPLTKPDPGRPIDEPEPTTAQPDPEPRPTPAPEPGDASPTQDSGGGVPQGFCIVADTPVAPAGFHRTGLTLKAQPWSESPPPPVATTDTSPVACVLVNGVLYAFYSDGDLWAYQGERDQWRRRAPMPEGGSGFAAASLRDHIHVLGGRNASGQKLDRHHIYHPASDTWSEGPPMPTPRDKLAAVSALGSLFAMGGEGRAHTVLSGRCKVNEIYDPAADGWKHGTDLPHARSGMAIAASDDRIHLLGGEVGRFQWHGHASLHECYLPDTGVWERRADLPEGTGPLQAVGSNRGIHLFGGAAGATSTRHLCYTYARDQYREMEALPERPMVRSAAGDAARIYLLDGNGGSMLHQYVRDSLLHVHRKD